MERNRDEMEGNNIKRSILVRGRIKIERYRKEI